MKMKLLCIAFALTGCTASLIKVEPDDLKIKTIGYQTGTQTDDGLYASQFRTEAERLCDGGAYDLLESGRHPSTLEGMVLPKTMFYWVVRCRETH